MNKQIPSINAPGALGIYGAGAVIRQGEEFFAFDADGKCIGVFDSMIEASREIPRTRRAAADALSKAAHP